MSNEYLVSPGHAAGKRESRPILKWAGGKTQLLPELFRAIPDEYGTYIEPFLGGGALFFALQPIGAIIADSNPELINLYREVAHNVEGVIGHLKEFKNDRDMFYEVRGERFGNLNPTYAAARTMYLNRTCFNGLYRLNKKGQFNVPFGKYNNPTICNAEALRAASRVLAGARILLGDYRQILRAHARPGDLVYLDPPYLPVSKYADFKRYTTGQFHEADHRELAVEVQRLRDMGCHVILTNSNHPLVHKLYETFSIQVVATKRNINKKGNLREGVDVIVKIPSERRNNEESRFHGLPTQVQRYPSTRFMGSKEWLLPYIWDLARSFEFDSVLDLFSGSGAVGYMFKAQGKQVFSNDYMAMCAAPAIAMIENDGVLLEDDEVDMLLSTNKLGDNFVQKTFADLYYSEQENALIDVIRANMKGVRNRYKRAIALSALIRACLKKRPRGVFTYVGQRYDDGRMDLRVSLEQHFRSSVSIINKAIFDNGKHNSARRGDAMTVRWHPDLVYIDPPYYSPYSDNEYVRRYHFVEGLACDWQDVTMQWHTKTKKFKSYPTPFSSALGAQQALGRLFHRFRDSIIIVS